MTVKFTDLPSLAAVDIADDDVLAVSDISAAASKKVTVADLLSSIADLTQLQVEDPASTVFGQVSGERLAQAGVVSFTAQEQQIGVGQTWQLVTRSVNVWYQNTTGKPIGVFGRGSISSPVVWDVGPSTTDFIVIDMSDGDSSDSADYGWIIVPVDHYYRNTATWNSARELR